MLRQPLLALLIRARIVKRSPRNDGVRDSRYIENIKEYDKLERKRNNYGRVARDRGRRQRQARARRRGRVTGPGQL